MNVTIKDSPIHGKGVFAARDFKKGDIVLRWDVSDEISKEEADSLSEIQKHYVNLIEGKYIIMQEPERYVNHSCDPNTTVKGHCDVAIRDINKGEEITSDYTTQAISGMTMECDCGSENCRGRIEIK